MKILGYVMLLAPVLLLVVPPLRRTAERALDKWVDVCVRLGAWDAIVYWGGFFVLATPWYTVGFVLTGASIWVGILSVPLIWAVTFAIRRRR